MPQEMAMPPGFQEYERSDSLMQGREAANLIDAQLEVDTLLNKIEHMLRGDIIKFDAKTGSHYWVKPKDENQQIFNDKGIQDILRALTMYLNKNTLLSNYDKETINNKVFNMASELNDMIFMRYEEYGLDTNQKRKLYPMIVNSIKDMVHSAYNRALGGKERDSIHTSRQVSENIGNHGGYMGMPYPMPEGNNSGGSLLNPMNWFKKRAR